MSLELSSYKKAKEGMHVRCRVKSMDGCSLSLIAAQTHHCLLGGYSLLLQPAWATKLEGEREKERGVWGGGAQ